MSPMFELTFADLFAAGCVAIYAWERFDRPPWRAMTPRVQWTVALLGYIVAAVVAWWMIASIISNQPETIATFFALQAPEETAEALAKLSAPLAAALALTVLLPNTPVLKQIDLWLQTRFRELGAIPKAARRLAWQMKRAEFELPASLAASVRRRLTSQGLEPDSMVAAAPTSPAGRWVTVVAIMERLQDEALAHLPDHGADPGGDRSPAPDYLRDLEIQYAQNRLQYRRLAAMAGITLSPNTDHSGGGLLGTFEEETEALFRSLCVLVACALLRKSLRARMAVAELREWGFKVTTDQQSGIIRTGDIVGLSCLLFLYFLFMVQVFGIGSGKIPKAMYMSGFIAVTLAAAAVCVGVPRLLLGREITAQRRYHFEQYALAAVFAAICWCMLFYIQEAVFEGASVEKALAEFRIKWPFMLNSVAAAFVLALLVDADLERKGLPRPVARCCEGLAVGLALAVVGWQVAELLPQIRPTDQMAPDGGSPRTEHMIQISAGLGVILGVLVPHLYRRAAEAASQAAPLSATIEQEFRSAWETIVPTGDLRGRENRGNRPNTTAHAS